MGCTSSAPTPQLPISATDETDGGLKIEENVDTVQNSDEIQVLPSCDSVRDPGNLASNITMDGTAMDAPSLENNPIEDNCIQSSNDETRTSEEKLPTLEEVVEQVVELYVIDNKQEDTDIHKDDTMENITNVVVEDQAETVDEANNEGIDDKVRDMDLSEGVIIAEEKVELKDLSEEGDTADLEETAVLDETASPSQSTSSRMTRWEALADIAAELPPSLAVDPLTGQIYTLTK